MKLYICDEFNFSMLDHEKQNTLFCRKPRVIENKDVDDWIVEQFKFGRLLTCAIRDKDNIELIKNSLNLSILTNPIDFKLELADILLVPEISDNKIIRWWSI